MLCSFVFALSQPPRIRFFRLQFSVVQDVVFLGDRVLQQCSSYDTQ